MIASEPLESLLPWRHPFLLLDRMVACEPHRSIRTTKQVTGNDPLAPAPAGRAGVWPAVLVLEGLNQSAALLYRMTYGPVDPDRRPLLGYMKARFPGAAAPGDTIAYLVRAVKMTSTRGLFEGTARVGRRSIVRAELAFAIVRPGGGVA